MQHKNKEEKLERTESFYYFNAMLFIASCLKDFLAPEQAAILQTQSMAVVEGPAAEVAATRTERANCAQGNAAVQHSAH